MTTFDLFWKIRNFGAYKHFYFSIKSLPSMAETEESEEEARKFFEEEEMR